MNKIDMSLDEIISLNQRNGIQPSTYGLDNRGQRVDMVTSNSNVSPLNRDDLPLQDEDYRPASVMSLLDFQAVPTYFNQQQTTGHFSQMPPTSSRNRGFSGRGRLMRSGPLYSSNRSLPTSLTATDCTASAQGDWNMHRIQRSGSDQMRTRGNWMSRRGWMSTRQGWPGFSRGRGFAGNNLGPGASFGQRGGSAGNNLGPGASFGQGGDWAGNNKGPEALFTGDLSETHYKQLELVQRREMILNEQQRELMQEKQLLRKQKMHLLNLEKQHNRWIEEPHPSDSSLTVSVTKGPAHMNQNDVNISMKKRRNRHSNRKQGQKIFPRTVEVPFVSQSGVQSSPQRLHMPRPPGEVTDSIVDIVLGDEQDSFLVPTQTSLSLSERFTRKVNFIPSSD